MTFVMLHALVECTAVAPSATLERGDLHDALEQAHPQSCMIA